MSEQEGIEGWRKKREQEELKIFPIGKLSRKGTDNPIILFLNRQNCYFVELKNTVIFFSTNCYFVELKNAMIFFYTNKRAFHVLAK